MIEKARPRILVVDDEPNVLATLEPILALEGFAVDTAADANGARAALELNGGYDVVITDLRLGDDDGLSVAEAVHVRGEGTPVIVLTGFGSLESAVDAMHKGVYDYLLKPCDVEELKATVRRALDHGRMSRSLQERVSALEGIADRDVLSAEQKVGSMQGEIRRLAVELEGSKRDLELALARERAMVAQLRERDEMRNQFISNISHELKTPLTSIRGYAELLLRSNEPVSDRSRRAVNAMLRASDQLATLVQDLLDMTAIEASGLSVQPRPLVLEEVITTAMQLAEPMAREKNLRLVADVARVLPNVLADPGRLGQVLNNLLSNAIKFTPSGGTVEVGARSGGDLVHVWVRDTGLGIPPDEHRRLFSRFFHASTTPPASRGLGLGLYIVRAIVEAQGGMVWVESEPGAGTTFHFTVPFVVEPGAVTA
ncbi:MAG: hypothetical protein AUH85_17270 [Chloroflexi bacterium 13_1_40CM_4_68_4]|nr:MAG: hypothetical protein AUH85_17270 [Chloroflexi bacterium 13_1_40CM_4_68_4]